MSLWRSLASTIVSELRLAEQREGADAANIKEVVRQLKTLAGNVRRPGEAPTDNIKKQDYIMKFTFTFGLDKFLSRDMTLTRAQFMTCRISRQMTCLYWPWFQTNVPILKSHAIGRKENRLQ